MSDKHTIGCIEQLTTEDGFSGYRDDAHERLLAQANAAKKLAFQRQLAEFLDREDMVKAVTKAVESEKYVNDIVRVVIAAIKKEAGK